MKNFLSFILAISVITGIGVSSTSGDEMPKLRVLIITGGHNFDREPFFAMFDSFRDIHYREVQQPQANELYVNGQAQDYDVIIFYDMVQDITEPQKQAMMELFKRGKGLVVLHHAYASYNEWDEYEKLIGCRYLLAAQVRNGQQVPGSTYQHDVDFPVHIVDPEHPVTKGMKDFILHDEVYGGVVIDESVTPLLTTEHPQSNHLIGWTHQYGKSHVVTIQPGHGPTSWNNPNYRAILHNAILWVADHKLLRGREKQER